MDIDDPVMSIQLYETYYGFRVVETYKSGMVKIIRYYEPEPDVINTGSLKAFTGGDSFNAKKSNGPVN